MLRSFDIFPGNIPSLDPAGTDIARGPRHVLERPADAAGLTAARAFWALYQDFGEKSPGCIRVPLKLFRPGSGNLQACSWHQAPRRSPGEAPGAGYVLFPDLSLLVLHRCDALHWGNAGPEAPWVDILPIVLRVSPVLETRFGTLRQQVLQDENGATRLGFARPFDDDAFDAPKMIREQMEREVASWAAWIPRMPRISPEDAWPSFFPRSDFDPKRLQRFRTDTLAAVQSVMAWCPDIFSQVQVSAWSSRPLQGSREPMRLVLNWDFTGMGKAPMPKEVFDAHVHGLLFGPGSPWRMDDFPGLVIRGATSPSPTPDRVELFTELLRAPASNHARLALRTRFPAPPPAPPLPGEPGYGAPFAAPACP